MMTYLRAVQKKPLICYCLFDITLMDLKLTLTFLTGVHPGVVCLV